MYEENDSLFIFSRNSRVFIRKEKYAKLVCFTVIVLVYMYLKRQPHEGRTPKQNNKYVSTS